MCVYVCVFVQVIQGLRKCTNLHIQYTGDPLLQPIRSFENATLVRALYQLSCSLNDKVGSCTCICMRVLTVRSNLCVFLCTQLASQLAVLGTSNRLTSKLLLQLLAPPLPSPYVATVIADQDV